MAFRLISMLLATMLPAFWASLELATGGRPVREGFVVSVHKMCMKIVLLTLSPRRVTDPQAPREGIPLGRYAQPNYYTHL